MEELLLLSCVALADLVQVINIGDASSYTFDMTVGSGPMIFFHHKSDWGQTEVISYRRDKDPDLEPGIVNVWGKFHTAVKSTHYFPT